MVAVFLDFDGVITGTSLEMTRPWIDLPDGHQTYPLNREKCTQLDFVLGQNQVDVVISSTWRFMHRPEILEQLLFDYGFKRPIFGVTNPRIFDRWQAIKAHPLFNDQSIVIDDEPCPLACHSIRPRSVIGMTHKNFQELRKCLTSTK